MSDKQKCACCGLEMDKNYIGQHYNWELCVKNLKAENARLTAENERLRKALEENKKLRGAMAADDERLRVEGERAGVEHCGCDTAHWMADEILGLRQKLTEQTDLAKEYDEDRVRYSNGWIESDNKLRETLSETRLREAVKEKAMAEGVERLQNLIIEADAQFNEGKKPGDIESAGLALVRMCSEGRSAMDKVQELQQELEKTKTGALLWEKNYNNLLGLHMDANR